MRYRALLLAVLGLSFASAECVTAREIGPPMQVKLVRASGDCLVGCPEWIAAQGRIDARTPGEFRAVFAKLGKKRLPVVIHSPGGALGAAMTIAQWIRGRGLDVIVGQTTLLPCDPILPECKALENRGFMLGRLEKTSGSCASACPVIVSGGVRRFIAADARIGIHSMATYRGAGEREWTTTEPDPTAPGGRRTVVRKGTETKGPAFEASVRDYAQLRKFYEGMGVSGEILDLSRAVPYDQIEILPSDKVTSLGLATHAKGPHEVLFGEAPKPTSVPSPLGPSSGPLFRKP